MSYAGVAEKLKMIPEQYLDEVSDFFDFILFRDKAKEISVPNAELVAALQESEEMLNNPNTKKFNSVDSLFADLFDEQDYIYGKY